MVFKDVPMIRIGGLMLRFGGTKDGVANLLPFRTILPYLYGGKGAIVSGINIVGNIVLLVPIGFLACTVYPDMNWKKSLVLGMVAGLLIEGMQLVLRVGIFDIDDIILNTLGVLVGHWVFAILAKIIRSQKR
jgi:glycopeptide antibiotics resistance protein